MEKELRRSGIDIIGDVPWGTHICQFYQTKKELMEILITYFKAGLDNNEFCLWVTSEPVEVEDAKDALRKSIPDFNTYLEKGQIEIIPYTDWFVTDGIFDPKRVSSSRFEKLNHALDNGFDGMRLSGNTTWLSEESWNNFIEFKEQTDKSMDTYRMINLCTYFLDRHNAAEIIDVVVNHQFALIKKEGKWKSIESSKRKMAEAAAVQATKNWEYTFDAVPDLIAIIDDEYRIVRANRAMAARLGVTPEECAGLVCYRVVHGTDSPPCSCPHRQMLENGLEHTREVHEDSLGGDFIVSVSPLHDSEGKLTGCIHIARDITKRKRAEEALLESEERLRFALETIHAGAWDLDLVNHTAFRSLEHDRIFGYDQLLPEWTYEMFLDHVLPEDRAMVDAKFRKAMTTCSNWNFECQIRRVDGEVRWIWAAGRHRADATGSGSRMVGIVQDITERKQLEEQTRQRAEEIETVMEVAPVAIWIGHDPQCHNITGNQMANEIYEAKFGENVSANVTPVRRFFHKGRELTADELPMQEATLKDIDVRNAEFDVLLPSGEWRGLMGSASPLHDADGHVRGSVGTFIDITERKKAEESLRNSEMRLRRLYESGLIGVIYFTLEGQITDANDRFLKLVGYTREDVQAGKVNWEQMTPPEYRALDKYIIEKLKDTGVATPYEKEFIRKDGSRVPVILGAATIDEARQECIAFVLDITESKKIEKALRRAHDSLEEKVKERTAELNEAYDSLIENDRRLSEAQKMAHIGNWDWNIITDKKYCSDEMYRIFGLDPEKFHPTYDAFLNFVHPDDRARMDNAFKRALDGRKLDAIDCRIVLADGRQRVIHIQAEVIFNEKQIPVRVRGTVQDITEKKEAEEAFLNAITARKKEIHHRIKNNLQVISSLLDLQAEKFKNRKHAEDFEVLEAFRESQDRVISIALIHEELHEGEGADTLNFSQYLQKLVENLFETYRFGNPDISLNLNLEEDVFFGMDTAVPLGMIVNELVSNSFKHAFPGGKTGEIRINLCKEEKGKTGNGEIGGKNEAYKSRYILTVSDSGAGIPEEIDLENSDTLGTQLVTILVDQLDGELELKRDFGTEFVIKLTVAENQ
ncbi:PAS domain S-box protein [Methanosarcina sp.]|uniref:PAS domain S-box protein n=1 Tax=Methanosarcina sp. TaxID=2213 RepID=UPI003C754065